MQLKAGLVWLLIAVLLSGCGGRAANPIMVQQYGDDKKTCQAIKREMTFIQSEMQRLQPQTDKTAKNTILGVTGFFFLVPLLFLDLSKAEQIELDAYRQRYNHLLILAGDKQCGIKGKQIPEFGKSNSENRDHSN